MFRTILFVIIFIISSKSLFSLDWDKTKYSRPQDDPQWQAQVKPDTEEYDSLCEAAKTSVWSRVYQEKKQEFTKLVNSVSKIILETKSNIIGSPKPEVWEQAFKKAQMSWIEQIELDRYDYYYSESALGGNRYWRDSLRFAVEKIDQRIKDIKSRWWLEDFVNIIG